MAAEKVTDLVAAVERVGLLQQCGTPRLPGRPAGWLATGPACGSFLWLPGQWQRHQPVVDWRLQVIRCQHCGVALFEWP